MHRGVRLKRRRNAAFGYCGVSCRALGFMLFADGIFEGIEKFVTFLDQ